MIALEAMREVLIYMEVDISNLYDCIEDFGEELNTCNDHIWDSIQPGIVTCSDGVYDQQQRLADLYDTLRVTEQMITQDRAALILYCQQFSFSQEMVRPCAAILTCVDTQLDYRWDPWEGFGHSPHHHSPTPPYVQPVYTPPQPYTPPTPEPDPHSHTHYSPSYSHEPEPPTHSDPSEDYLSDYNPHSQHHHHHNHYHSKPSEQSVSSS